jgi:hypothetical protein
MPQGDQLPRPMMRGRAGFHAHKARLQTLEKRDDLGAAQTALDDNLAGGVDAVDLKPVLGEIKPEGGNLQGERLLS